MMNPNMMPNQMGMQPQMDMGGQMPAADPSQIQAEIDALSGQEKQEAKQAMDQILQIIEQMKAQGASEEEIGFFSFASVSCSGMLCHFPSLSFSFSSLSSLVRHPPFCSLTHSPYALSRLRPSCFR